jgi:Acetyltransferase (GNAT) domain
MNSTHCEDFGHLIMGHDASNTERTDLLGTIVRINDPNEVETGWRELESRCNPSFFLAWEWIGPWANLVSKHTELYLFSAKSGESCVAMCFLTISHIKRLRGLIKVKQVMLNEFVNDECDMTIQYNGILSNDNDTELAWRTFCHCLMEWNKSWDELALSSVSQTQLDKISNECHRLTLKVDRINKEWKVPLRPELGEINALIGQFKSKSRHQLRQSLKAFEKELGPVSILAATNTEDALQYFESMGKLHTEKWVKAGAAGCFANQKWVNFHEKIIRNGFPNGRILLFAINSGETNIGYLYGHLYNNTAYMQQTGFAPMQQNILKPGYVSHLLAMSYCADKGISEYDFLPDDETSYKKFFSAAGDSMFWVLLQKNRAKFILEKYIRRFAAFLKARRMQTSQ